MGVAWFPGTGGVNSPGFLEQGSRVAAACSRVLAKARAGCGCDRSAGKVTSTSARRVQAVESGPKITNSASATHSDNHRSSIQKGGCQTR